MDDSFLIRPARREDCADLTAMIAELAAYHGEHAAITAQTLDRLAFDPGSALRFLVTERGAALVGFAALAIRHALRTGLAACEIEALYVRFRFRRRGVGRALVAACAREARKLDAGSLRLGVRPQNWAARAFYMKLGFAETPPSGLRCTLQGEGFAALAEDEYWREAA